MGDGIRGLGKCIQVQWRPILWRVRQPVCSDCCLSSHLVYCGRSLFETLLANWSGTCILVQLAISFTLAFQHSKIPQVSRDKNETLVPLVGHLTLTFISMPLESPGEFLMSLKLGTKLLQDSSQFCFGDPL
jgi:hypothetical protein